jgi:hypothetical protein
VHAVFGGSYCDVFIYDRFTGKWLAPVRRQLGLPPSFVLAKYPGGTPKFRRRIDGLLARVELLKQAQEIVARDRARAG